MRMMQDRYALERVRPRTSIEKKTLLVIAGCVLGAALIAAGLHEIVSQSQRIRERDWMNAFGTIEDVRGVLVVQASGYAGGGMLYNVQVLAAFPIHGVEERRWIRVGERPTGWDGVEMEKRRLKGRHCLVLVNPKNLEQAAVECTKD
jgi:hypothetical protein